ncbi:LIM homeobox transcription factor 1-beta.1-like [Tropilaelaps mercedesae]|uniref:LIM homeobox transcription factor 1-beta.1-like n=1 Tax=Tropilaelaps mercedesae TaxID=418985 RepID=A0A1V9XBN8_9ACAR|nr:LIM homeobox transcription factor 1-beta.1-like [Tropilaelaps mercedesae]
MLRQPVARSRRTAEHRMFRRKLRIPPPSVSEPLKDAVQGTQRSPILGWAIWHLDERGPSSSIEDHRPPPGPLGLGTASIWRLDWTRLEACSGCERPIVDRYIMKVRESSWHESCLVCSVCHQHLNTSCYSRDRRIFCKSDYDR